VYGKILGVSKSASTITYTYDGSCNRISKTLNGVRTWYVRDASGNVMAVYESGNATVNGGNLSQIEVHLYGSSRLGMWTPNHNVQSIPAPVTYPMTGLASAGVVRTYKRGLKFFELSNHLGNVLVAVTDRKVAIQNGTTGTILTYVADVVSGGDYYPFGMQMPGRNFSADKYRYGFNGKEKDKDINSLTAYDYGFRIYNPAIGKFLSVDPLTNNFPWYSPYHVSGNNPIRNIDLDGGEPLDYVEKWVHRTMIINDYRRTETEVESDNLLGVYSYEGIYDEGTKRHWFIMQKPNDPTYYYWKHIDGADPNRLIQSTTGKLNNGTWVPFETQNQIQARIGVAVAKGMAKFWYLAIASTIATGGKVVLWVGEAILEDAVGVPIINSPDDFIRRKETSSVREEIVEKARTVSDDIIEEGKKLPSDRLRTAPDKPGKAPIGEDGHPVELHHRDQSMNGPLDEMTRTEHRGKGNYSRNHPNTGQDPSQINRNDFRKQRKEYWKKEHESGRFDNLD